MRRTLVLPHARRGALAVAAAAFLVLMASCSSSAGAPPPEDSQPAPVEAKPPVAPATGADDPGAGATASVPSGPVAPAPAVEEEEPPPAVRLVLPDPEENAEVRLRLARGGAWEVHDAAPHLVSAEPLDGTAPTLLGSWAAIVHQRHDVLDLSLDGLRRAVTGVVGDWSSLGGRSAPITVLVPESERVWLRRALAIDRFATGTRFPSLAFTLDEVARTPGALALVPITALRPGVLPLVIDEFDPLRDPGASSPLRLQRWVQGPQRDDLLDALSWRRDTPTDPVGLLATGDYVPVRCVPAAVDAYEAGDFTGIFKEVGGMLAAADITIVSMEASATDRSQTPCERTFFLTAPPAAIDALSETGVDVVTTGGNHAGDCYGGCGWRSAVLDTIDLLDTAGIAHTGTGADLASARTPATIERDGVRFAVLSYDAIAGYYHAKPDDVGTAPYDLESIVLDVRRAAETADHVIVALSWGAEYETFPSLGQDEAVRRMLGAGASLVVGNHPHAVQAVREDARGLAAYALGNFVFDQDWSSGTTQSVLLEVGFDRERILGYRLRPIVIRHNYRPEAVDPAGEGRAILNRVWASTDAVSDRLPPPPPSSDGALDGWRLRELAELSPEAAAAASRAAIFPAPDARPTAAVAVLDLDDRLLYVQGLDRTYRIASVAKVGLLLATLLHATDPRERELARGMIVTSDNPSADFVWGRRGPEEVAQVWRSADLEGVYIDDATWGGAMAHAWEVGLLFASIVEPGVFPPGVALETQALLESVTADQAWGVSAGLPNGWSVGLKNGWTAQDGAWLVHTAGYLKDSGGAARYVIVVLSWGHLNLNRGVMSVEAIVAPIQAALHAAR